MARGGVGFHVDTDSVCVASEPREAWGAGGILQDICLSWYIIKDAPMVLCDFYCLPKSMVLVLYYVWIIWCSFSKRILTYGSVLPCLTMFI